jgi:hypothetical protein
MFLPATTSIVPTSSVCGGPDELLRMVPSARLGGLLHAARRLTNHEVDAGSCGSAISPVERGMWDANAAYTVGRSYTCGSEKKWKSI